MAGRRAEIQMVKQTAAVLLCTVCLLGACHKAQTASAIHYISVEATCVVPPLPELTEVPLKKCSDGDMLCLSIPAAAQLAGQLAAIRTWAQEVLARCSKPIEPVIPPI